MPYLLIKTNAEVAAKATAPLLDKASQLVAELLAKPEAYVMVDLEAGRPMRFAASTAPLACLELKSIGLPKERTPELSAALCAFVEAELGIGKERVYIEFSDAERALWGWNGATF